MKILKVCFSVFLLVIMGLAIITPSSAMTAITRIYPYYYPYNLPVIDGILNLGDHSGANNSIHIPSPTEIIKNFK